MSPNKNSIDRRRPLLSPATLLLILAVLTAYRAWVIVHNRLPLFFDEAQYWVWSLTPDWGYYSKPPMVAWVIRLFSLLGDGELEVRFGTLLLHPLTAVLLYLLGKRMFDAMTAMLAAILFITLPLVGFNSLFMTTDAPLFFFWALATFALWRALESNAWSDWILVGIAAGLGLLSKYSMAVFAPSVALVLCLPAFRAQWRNPRLYIAALLALAVFLPNLWWNARMDFVSFRHTAEISQLDRGLFHPARLAEFIGGQFACMGPVGFALLLRALASRSVWRDRRLGFLAAMTLPFLAVISLQALLARANVNWAAPAYFAGTLLATAHSVMPSRKRMALWLGMIILNLVLLSGFYHYRALADAFGVKLTSRTDPYARVLGWPQMGAAVRQVLAENPETRLAVTDRSEFALLDYYVRPHPDRMRIWNPEGARQNHFHLVADIRQDAGASFILVARNPLGDAPAAAFERWSALGTVSVPLYPDFSLTLHLYRGDRFKGYPQ
ncbi:glycosyltransferase family 39 protein [Herbaspirillum sp. HC18]|nr:glycosyltransferase family 39 protein [Herbaspirillum sp. HC18]